MVKIQTSLPFHAVPTRGLRAWVKAHTHQSMTAMSLAHLPAQTTWQSLPVTPKKLHHPQCHLHLLWPVRLSFATPLSRLQAQRLMGPQSWQSSAAHQAQDWAQNSTRHHLHLLIWQHRTSVASSCLWMWHWRELLRWSCKLNECSLKYWKWMDKWRIDIFHKLSFLAPNPLEVYFVGKLGIWLGDKVLIKVLIISIFHKCKSNWCRFVSTIHILRCLGSPCLFFLYIICVRCISFFFAHRWPKMHKQRLHRYLLSFSFSLYFCRGLVMEFFSLSPTLSHV